MPRETCELGDAEELLVELSRRRGAERAALLAAHGEPARVVCELVGAAERLVMGDLQRALDATSLLVEVADEVADEGGRALARRARGQALAYANRFEEALETLKESVHHAGCAGDERTAARARLTMVHVLARVGRYEQALEAGSAARASFQKLGDLDWAAKAEVNLGITHRLRGDPEAALQHFGRARPAFAGDPVGMAHVESNRADALLELNRFGQAEEAFRSALAAFERAGIARAAAIVEGNLADLLGRQGRLDLALYHFERAMRRLEGDGALGDRARLEAEQAEALAGAGLLDEAAAAYASALTELDRHELVLEAARARIALGRALIELGRLDEAAAVLEEAARQFSALGHTAGGAAVALRQGELAVARSQTALALELLGQALRGLEARPAEAAVARHHLAQAALARGDLGRAGELLTEAIGAAEQYNLAPLLADLLHVRAGLHERRGGTREALDDLRAAAAQVERIRGSLQADRLRAAFAGNRAAVYEDLVAGLLRETGPERVAEAFRAVEAARSRSLLDLVAGAVRSAAVVEAGQDASSAPLVDRVLRLRGELNALYTALPAPDPPARREAAVRRWRGQVEACERELQKLEGRLSTTQGLGGLFAAPAALPEVQALLEADTALVEYFAARGELVAFVVRRDGARCFRLGSMEQAAEAVELVRFQIERAISYPPEVANDRLVADAQRELKALHAAVVAPLSAAIAGARRLVLVPHGALHAAPFAAAFDGRRSLLEDHEIIVSPSASLLTHLQPVPDSAALAEGTSLIFGVADAAAPHIEEEVAAAAAHLPGPRVWRGEEATWERLQAESAQAAVVHLACHAAFSPRNPLASGVKLGDRWLTVRDVHMLKLRGAVVVLSGCDTGRAAAGPADELVGLVRGFFAAGASALLMSQWALHDLTAKNVLASMYGLWQDTRPERTRSLSAALVGAQRRAMREDPHPVFWGPLVLVGRP